MKVKLSFGHKVVILSLSILNIKLKICLQKLLSLVCYLTMWHKKWKANCNLVTHQSFCHFLNYASKQNISFPKLFSFVYYLRMWHKKWNLSCHSLLFWQFLDTFQHFLLYQSNFLWAFSTLLWHFSISISIASQKCNFILF